MRLFLIMLFAVASSGAAPASGSADGDGSRSTRVTVREAGGAPVAGAAVRFLSRGESGPGIAKQCESGPEGTCSVALRSGEAVWLEVEKDGFPIARRSGVVPGASHVVVLDRPALIQGTVVDQDGRPFGPLELLVIDTTILMDEERVPVMPPLVRVGENGKFQVAELPAGEYTLSTIASDTVTASLTEPVRPIRIAPGKSVSGVVVRVVRHGALVGRIIFTDGVPDEVKVTPVPKSEPGGNSPQFDKVYVEARQRPCVKVNGLECGFKLEGLHPGLYEVEVEAKGYGPFLAPLPENVLPGKETKVPDVYAATPVRLAGKVRDREKKPVGGAVLAVYFPDIPLAVLDAESDAEGRFPPLLVSPGKYRIEISHRDFLTHGDSISVSGEFDTHELEASLNGGNRLEGIYVSSLRQPKGGVEIAAGLEPGDGLLRETLTDATGRFAFGGLAPGKYLVFALDGLDTAYKRVEITKGSSQSIVLDAIKDRPPIPPPMLPEGSAD